MKKLEESAKLGGIEKERRIVSILFCDVVGSTKHAKSMDPEEWLEIMASISIANKLKLKPLMLDILEFKDDVTK